MYSILVLLILPFSPHPILFFPFSFVSSLSKDLYCTSCIIYILVTSRNLSNKLKDLFRRLLVIVPEEILETEDAAEILTTPAAAPSASGVSGSRTEFRAIALNSVGSGPSTLVPVNVPVSNSKYFSPPLRDALFPIKYLNHFACLASLGKFGSPVGTLIQCRLLYFCIFVKLLLRHDVGSTHYDVKPPVPTLLDQLGGYLPLYSTSILSQH